MTDRRTTDDVASLQAQLRRVDDFAAKGLMREEEADEARLGLRKRLLQAVVPDQPAPRLPWRVRLWAAGAMVVLVGVLGLYVLSGQAGLRRQSLQALDAARAARAQREASQAAAFAQLRVEKQRAQSAPGAVAGAAPLPAAASSNTKASAQGTDAGSTASGAGAVPASSALPASSASIAPLLAGRIELAAALRGETRPEDTVFVLVRSPDDPTGLPLAAIRRTVGDLPLAFAVREAELVGDERRFLEAKSVVVSARVSRSGSGRPETGDLAGTTAPLAPWSSGVVVVIDRALP